MFGSNKKEENNRFSSFLFLSYVSTLETKILPVIPEFQKFLIIKLKKIRRNFSQNKKNCPCFYRGFPLWFILFVIFSNFLLHKQ